jgi:hypothetical protein
MGQNAKKEKAAEKAEYCWIDYPVMGMMKTEADVEMLKKDIIRFCDESEKKGWIPITLIPEARIALVRKKCQQ